MSKAKTIQVTRQQVEDFIYHEAALLDAWRLDDWLELLTADAVYCVPSNDRPYADPKKTLFIIADDINRIRARVTRLKDKSAHAEYPPSRTRRIITNVRIVGEERQPLVQAPFVEQRGLVVEEILDLGARGTHSVPRM